jgi:phosphate transport system substrate-binding protein
MNTMRSNIWMAALLLLPAAASADVVYGGSSTVAEVLQGGISKGFEARSGKKVQVADTSGSGKGLKSLAEGKVNVAGSGRVLSADEKRSGLLGTIVGYDGLAAYVNKANPVKDLSKEQLKDIFTGKVKSWKQLGGKDVKIVPIVEPLASKRATVQTVQEQVLDGAAFAPGIREVDQLKDQLAEVARGEGTICFASVGFLASADGSVRGAVRAIAIDSTDPTDSNIRSGAYLLSRPMLLVTKGLPNGDVKAFLDYVLSRDGQAVVERYFVAVKK